MRNSIIALIGFLLISPILTSAISPESVTPENIAGGGVIKANPSPIQNVSGIVGVVASVVRWVYIIFFIIAVMYVLFAAFAYLSGGDDVEKMKVVHDRIKYAAIAIAVALMAVGLEMIVKNFLTTGGNGGGGANTEDYWRINPGGNLPTPTDSWRSYLFQKENQPSPPPVLPESL